MEILKSSGTYRILTPTGVLLNQLLIIEEAGRTSYQSQKGPITLATAAKFVRMLIRNGHESVIEHGSLSVKFTGVSRGFTHEDVRHRLSSFTQESTRYVDYAKGGDEPDLERFQARFILPPHRDEQEIMTRPDGRQITPAQMFEEAEQNYRTLRLHGWKPQDARQVLPIGIESDLVHTANFREWRHIFKLRTAKDAHWEIRLVMCALLQELQTILPAVFDDLQYAGQDQDGHPYFKTVKI